MTKNDEGGDTGQFQINEKEDVAEYIDGDSTAQVQVPVDEGGGDVQVPDDESGGEDAVNAPVEAGVDMAKDDEGVRVPVDEGPELAKDEEGGGVIPAPVDGEAGRLRIVMTKQDCFAHGGEGGIAKSEAAALSF